MSTVGFDNVAYWASVTPDYFRRIRGYYEDSKALLPYLFRAYPTSDSQESKERYQYLLERNKTCADVFVDLILLGESLKPGKQGKPEQYEALSQLLIKIQAVFEQLERFARSGGRLCASLSDIDEGKVPYREEPLGKIFPGLVLTYAWVERPVADMPDASEPEAPEQ